MEQNTYTRIYRISFMPYFFTPTELSSMPFKNVRNVEVLEDFPIHNTGKSDNNLKNNHHSKATSRYGSEWVALDETPSFLQDSLEKLQMALDNLDSNSKKVFDQAKVKCPEQCQEHFFLKHLRAEKFQIRAAALRIVRYWQERLTLFQQDCFKPMEPYGTLDHSAIQWLRSSLYQIIGKDDVGRPILLYRYRWMPQTAQDWNEHRISILKAHWYIMEKVTEDVTAQRYGFIFFGNSRGLVLGHYDKEFQTLSNKHLKTCLPVRVPAGHLCQCPLIMKMMIKIMKPMLNKVSKSRLILHDGKTKEIIYSLKSTYSIPNDCLLEIFDLPLCTDVDRITSLESQVDGIGGLLDTLVHV